MAELDLRADEVGDNEPYDGALAGDTIDEIATARGLANALIEIRQDLIAEAPQRERMGRTPRARAAADHRRSTVARARRSGQPRAWSTSHRRGKLSSAT